MEEKEFNKQVKINTKAKNQLREDFRNSDHSMHSTEKGWQYDPKTGKLVARRKNV